MISGANVGLPTESGALRHYLDAQRDSALAVLEGLSDDHLRTPVLPSGWTLLGMLQHLGFAERYWFQTLFCGHAAPLQWDEDEHTMTTRLPAADVFTFYRDQCQRSNTVLATNPLDAAPAIGHPLDDTGEVSNLRGIALHMIEETSRHIGHLDVARELMDGRTGLGPR